MIIMEELVEKAIEYGLSRGCNYIDARLQIVRGTRIRIRNGLIQSITPSVSRGIGVRVLIENSWGFSSTTRVDRDSVRKCVDIAIKNALLVSSDVSQTDIANTPAVREEILINEANKVSVTPIETKMKVLLEIDKAIRKVGEDIKSTISYVDQYEEKVISTSEGSTVRLEDSWLFLTVLAYAHEAGLIQSYRTRFGALGGFDKLWKIDYENIGKEAAEKARNLLKAETTPAGKFTVIMDNELAGLLAHEAFGHAAEADSVMNGSSILIGRLGQKVASELVTIVDDATYREGFGSYKYDDEGVKGQRKLIVHKGILKGFLSSKETSCKLEIPLTGNARAESFGHPPIVRMSNTFFEKGDLSFEELIEDVKYGIYAKGGRGGQVSPIDGVFQFTAQEAYLIERGEITRPLRDFCMSGFILSTLKRISGIGKDFQLSPGFCGKNGQSVRVSLGGPHLRIEGITVGGQRWI